MKRLAPSCAISRALHRGLSLHAAGGGGDKGRGTMKGEFKSFRVLGF